jgi:hypothetical protein
MNSSETRRQDTALRWAARIVTLVAAAPWFIYLVPLLLALIAWRWHLLGGVLIVVGAMLAYIRLGTVGGTTWAIYLILLPLLIGGILHIMVGLRDRRHRLELPA